jgi:hypothetical protein
MNNDRAKLNQMMIDAMHEQNADKYTEAFNGICELIEKDVLEKAQELAGVHDQQVLASRGVRQLTSKEKKYYKKLIEAFKSENPKQALTDPEIVMPETVLDAVFDDLQTEHPLLSHISFTNTRGAIKFLFSKNDFQKAVWGKLCAEITEEIEASFSEIDMTLMKLSAFIPVCEAMLDLGPLWLDSYVRQILYEALANGLEDGIINNLNTTTGPVGMIANMTTGSGGVGAATFTAKTATPITDLQPATLGAQLAKLAVDAAGKSRAIRDVILIVNPTDYFTKVFPATTVMNGAGVYVNNVLPYPMTIIQSAAVATGKAVLGLGYKYFMGIGMDSRAGRIEYSDEFKWLDDERVYKIKLYANGMPMDNNAFQYLDISGLKPAIVRVTIENEEPITTTVEGTVTTQAAA